MTDENTYLDKQRTYLMLKDGDIIAIDTFGLLSREASDKIRRFANEFRMRIVELDDKFALIQIGPEGNIK